MKIRFDAEGIANCPDRGAATIEECLSCKYRKPTNNGEDTCIFEYVFPEPEEEYATQIL